MDGKDRLKQIEELVADHEILINELKAMNLRLSEIVMIDRKRLELLERPWYKRLRWSRVRSSETTSKLEETLTPCRRALCR